MADQHMEKNIEKTNKSNEEDNLRRVIDDISEQDFDEWREELLLMVNELRILKERDAQNVKKIKELTKENVELKTPKLEPTVTLDQEYKDKLQEINDKLAILSVERDGLQRKIDELNFLLSAKKEDMVAMRLAHHEAEEALQERNREIEMLKSRITMQASTAASLEKRFGSVKQEFAVVAKAFDFEKQCVQELKEYQGHLKKQIDADEVALDSAQALHRQDVEIVQQLKNKLKVVSSELQNKTAEHSRDRSQMLIHQARVASLTSQQQEMQEERKAFLNALDQAQVSVRESSLQVSRQEQTILEFRAQIDVLNKEKEEQRASLSGELQQSRLELIRRDAAMAEVKDEHNTQRQKWEDEVKDIKRTLSVSLDRAKFLNDAVNETRTREKAETDKNMKLKVKVQEQIVKICNMECDLEQEKQHSAQLTEKISTLEAELKQLTLPKPSTYTVDQIDNRQNNNSNITRNETKKSDFTPTTTNTSSTKFNNTTARTENAKMSLPSFEDRETDGGLIPPNNYDSASEFVDLSGSPGAVDTELSEYTVSIDQAANSDYLDLDVDYNDDGVMASGGNEHLQSLPPTKSQPNPHHPLQTSHQNVQQNPQSKHPRNSKKAEEQQRGQPLVPLVPPQPNRQHQKQNQASLPVSRSSAANPSQLCPCKRPSFGFMITCTQCNRPFHPQCLPPAAARDSDKFVCDSCAKTSPPTRATKKRRTKGII